MEDEGEEVGVTDEWKPKEQELRDKIPCKSSDEYPLFPNSQENDEEYWEGDQEDDKVESIVSRPVGQSLHATNITEILETFFSFQYYCTTVWWCVEDESPNHEVAHNKQSDSVQGHSLLSGIIRAVLYGDADHKNSDGDEGCRHDNWDDGAEGS